MGTFFAVDAAFWSDADVIDNFTPEDKYFYLYLLTSPHANVSGCYQLSFKQIANEIGYSVDTVEHLIKRFIEVHQVIDYSKENKEILIHKWGKHHWVRSDKYITALRKRIAEIKTPVFKEYLTANLNAFGESKDMVWIPYVYGMDTSFLFFSFHNSFTDTCTYELGEEEKEGAGEKGEEENPEEIAEENAEVVEAEVVEAELVEDFSVKEPLPLDCSPELIEAVRNWLAYKKEKNQSYKPRGFQSLMTTIQKNSRRYGDDVVIEVIEMSMANGYQGILWDRMKKKKGRSYMEMYGGTLGRGGLAE